MHSPKRSFGEAQRAVDALKAMTKASELEFLLFIKRRKKTAVVMIKFRNDLPATRDTGWYELHSLSSVGEAIA